MKLSILYILPFLLLAPQAYANNTVPGEHCVYSDSDSIKGRFRATSKRFKKNGISDGSAVGYARHGETKLYTTKIKYQTISDDSSAPDCYKAKELLENETAYSEFRIDIHAGIDCLTFDIARPPNLNSKTLHYEVKAFIFYFNCETKDL